MPDFRPCSTCMSRSQAPLCHCTLRLISAQAEGTFGRLRYLLGGDRPSQTARRALSGTSRSVRTRKRAERYFTDPSAAPARAASKGPAYPTQHALRPNAELQ